MVPKVNVIEVRSTSCDHCVEVVRRQIRASGERLPVAYPQIPLMVPTAISEVHHGRGHFKFRRDHNIYIHNWLGSQPRDSGAPDMLDEELLGNRRTNLGKPVDPPLVVLDYAIHSPTLDSFPCASS